MGILSGAAQQQAYKRTYVGPSAAVFAITVDSSKAGSADGSFVVPSSNTNYSLTWVKADDPNVTGSAHVQSASYEIVFGATGIYNVYIDPINVLIGVNDFDRFIFNNTGDKNKLLSLEQWGATQWYSVSAMFNGCVELGPTSSIDKPDLSQLVTTIAFSMFGGCSKATPNTTGWDVSTITSMLYMFVNCTVANPDVRDWDVSNVTDFGLMFQSCPAATPDVSLWDVAKGTSFSNMFYLAVLATPDVAGWITTSVNRMANMFRGCVNANPDISGFSMGLVTTTANMLNGVTNFDRDLSGWNVESLIDATGMLTGVTLSTANYNALLNGWNNQDLQPGVVFHAGNSIYSVASEAAHDLIDSADGWDIIDGGLLWSPDFIPTSLWLDASDESTITHVANAVSQWNDKSGNDNHAAQTTGSQQPAYNNSGSIESFVEGHHLRLVSEIPDVAYLMVVHKWLDKTGENRVIVGHNITYDFHGGEVATDMLFKYNTAPLLNTATATVNGADEDTIDLHRETIDTILTVTPTGPAALRLLGHDRLIAGRSFRGSYYGILAFDYVPSLATRQRLEGWASRQYGIPLVSGHPYENAPPLQRTWTPADIETELWLDAADISTITHVANSISQWDDKSGNDRHMIQSTGSLQAQYEASSVLSAGYPAVVLDGATKLGNTESFDIDSLVAVMGYKDGVDVTYDVYNSIFNNVVSGGVPRIVGNLNTAVLHSSNTSTVNSFVDGEAASSPSLLPMPKTLQRFAFNQGTAQLAILHQDFQAAWGWQGPVYEYIIPKAGTSAADIARLEGYLAHKHGTTLASGHAYENAAPEARAWTPADITTELWLDASDVSTITHVANSVSQWGDKSGNDNHFVQSTGLNQPTYVNGKIVYTNNSYMELDPNPSLTHVSMFVVRKTSDSPALDFQGDEGAEYSFAGQEFSTLNTLTGVFGTPVLYINGIARSVPTRNDVFEAMSTGETQVAGYIGANVDTWQEIKLGYPASPTFTNEGEYSEVLFVTGIPTKAMHQRIEGYLAHKHGAPLVDGHPYKFNAPQIGI